jgi:hypothetical protein
MLQFQLTADLDAVSATAMWQVWISADPAAGQAVLERGVPVRVLALVPVLLHRRAPADPGQELLSAGGGRCSRATARDALGN